MASQFQNRLLGTVILASIGVIVLPDLLDGEKVHYQNDTAAIPIRPNIAEQQESFEILEPIEDVAVLPESPVMVTQEQNPESDSLTVVERQVPEPNDYQDSAWIIQLMALKNANNAEKLVADLRKRGYQAHTKQENGFTRVIVGPDVSKSKLETQITELKAITGSKGQLLKFKPLNP